MLEGVQQYSAYFNRVQYQFLVRSVHQFIVKPKKGKRYNNTKRIGDVDFVVNTSEENAKASNREAVVISTPLSYEGPIKDGDTLLVHHNVFKFYNDMYGRRKSGKSFFKDDIFFLDEDQYFAYKRDGDWIGVGRYCFVKPVPKEESYIFKPVSHEPLVGEIAIINDGLTGYGLRVGDKVGFMPDMEYEFTVDGQLMYRLFDHIVTMQL